MFFTLQVTRDNVKSSGHFCGICRFHHWQCLIAAMMTTHEMAMIASCAYWSGVRYDTRAS
jgi:hypothetical protein